MMKSLSQVLSELVKTVGRFRMRRERENEKEGKLKQTKHRGPVFSSSSNQNI